MKNKPILKKFKILKFFNQQYIMENGTVEKTVKRNYDFVDNKAKVKNYY